MMNEPMKMCSRCEEVKCKITDFYMCAGKFRSECKACTIKKNISYQQEKKKIPQDQIKLMKREAYMKSYYAQENVRKKYVHYRKKFRDKHPGYFKIYGQKLRESKKTDGSAN